MCLCFGFSPLQVIEVKAKKRTGENNYMSCIRDTLSERYKDEPVALGGAFLVERGKAKLHIMVLYTLISMYLLHGFMWSSPSPSFTCAPDMIEENSKLCFLNIRVNCGTCR